MRQRLDELLTIQVPCLCSTLIRLPLGWLDLYGAWMRWLGKYQYLLTSCSDAVWRTGPKFGPERSWFGNFPGSEDSMMTSFFKLLVVLQWLHLPRTKSYSVLIFFYRCNNPPGASNSISAMIHAQRTAAQLGLVTVTVLVYRYGSHCTSTRNTVPVP